MKKKILTTIRILLKCMLACALFVCLWCGLTPLFRVNRTVQGDLFRNLPEDTIDIIALGSSHMQYAFNPGVMYIEGGYYSYVMGSACQPFSQSYYMLQEVLKTQSPSVVLIDVFTLLSQSEICAADGMYYLAIDEMSGETRFEAAGDVDKDEETVLSYQFDLLMNHDNWKTIDWTNLSELFEEAKPAEGYNAELGYVRQEPVVIQASPVWQYEVTETIELSDEVKEWIDRIICLCDENDITPIFIKTPYSIDQDNWNQLNAVFTYIEEQGVRTINYISRASEIGWYKDMDGDDWHNNSWGSEIITTDLAQYLQEEGLVKNHTENETMNTLLDEMNRTNAESFFDYRNVDVYRLLEDAPDYPVLTILRYFGNETTSIGETENALLQKVGFTKDFIEDPETDYYAIAINGEVLQESDSPFTYVYNDLTIQIDEEHIWVNESYYDDVMGEMNLVFLRDDAAVINSIPIDYASGWFWKKGCEGFACE